MPEIKGYRDLDQLDIERINNIKDTEIIVGKLWQEISGDPDTDKRWLAIAKTHFQEGFSAFVRAVAKPEDVF
jgi:hypothetical protein